VREGTGEKGRRREKPKAGALQTKNRRNLIEKGTGEGDRSKTRRKKERHVLRMRKNRGNTQERKRRENPKCEKKKKDIGCEKGWEGKEEGK